MSSILSDVKADIGVDDSDNSFDSQIMRSINTSFGFLHRIGAGPANGFSINDESTDWAEFISQDDPQYVVLEMCKQYISLRAEQLFDKTYASSYNSAIKDLVSEIEFSIFIEVDPNE